jgi:hypothetical protein
MHTQDITTYYLKQDWNLIYAESGLIFITFDGFLLQVVPLMTLMLIVYSILTLPFNLLKFKILKSYKNKDIMIKKYLEAR